MIEQIDCSPIQSCRTDNVVPGLCNIEKAECGGSLSGTYRKCGPASLKGCESLFQSIIGWIHDPAVDVAEFLKRK